MFRVICAFADRADQFHRYQPGDSYPRQGVEADPARLLELKGRGNAAGRPLIEQTDEPPAGKPGRRKKVTAHDA